MKREIIFLTAIILAVSTASAFSNLDFGKDRAAVIQLEGTITPTSSSGPFSRTGSITPQQVRNLNEKAMERNVKAIIYEINSGGGAVVASKEVMREIESVKVPTVCRFRDVAASGAYLISLGCDKIVADSATITGSIGVKTSYLEFSGLLKKLGVEHVNISSGRYKSVGSRYKNITEQEREILQTKTDKIHQEFIQLVQEERNLTAGQISEIRTGKVFLGSKAKKLGLVDVLGGRQTAVRVAENLTDEKLNTKKIETEKEFSIASLLASSSFGEFFGTGPMIKAELR